MATTGIHKLVRDYYGKEPAWISRRVSFGRERAGELRMESITVRAFKLADLEDRCEVFVHA